jgi:hypothetical protein
MKVKSSKSTGSKTTTATQSAPEHDHDLSMAQELEFCAKSSGRRLQQREHASTSKQVCLNG